MVTFYKYTQRHQPGYTLANPSSVFFNGECLKAFSVAVVDDGNGNGYVVVPQIKGDGHIATKDSGKPILRQAFGHVEIKR